MTDTPQPLTFETSESGEKILTDTREPKQQQPEPIKIPTEEAIVVTPDEVPEAPRSVDLALSGPKEKWLELGGYRYKCIDTLPARTYTRMVSTINGLALLKNMKDNDPASVAAIAIAFEQAVAIVERLVIDEHWPNLDERLDSKTDPVEFPELVNAVVKLFPLYSGASTPKA